MNKLEEARKKINQIDVEMLRLFVQRMEAVKEVAAYKKENHLPVFDEDRETILLQRNLSMLQEEILSPYYKMFFEGVLKSSKEYQKEIIK